MLNRTFFRGFKSWTQYLAERAKMSEKEFVEFTKVEQRGHYDIWRHRTEVKNKIDFLLDHCSVEEQKAYLKEFNNADLACYLLSEIHHIPIDEVNKLGELKVTHSVLPGFNSLLRLKQWISLAIHVSDKTIDVDLRIRRMAKIILENKMKELTWRDLDETISKDR